MTSSMYMLILVATGCCLTLTAAQDEECTAPIDMVFVVDQSGSICDEDPDNDGDTCGNWNLMRDFMFDIANRLTVSQDPLGAQVAMVRFSNKGKLDWDFTEYTNNADLGRAIKSLPYDGGNTNTSGGLWVAMDQVLEAGGDKRSGVRQVVIVITDGESTKDRDKTIPYAEALRANPYNAIIYAIGVTNQIDTNELKAISSLPQLENHQYFSRPEFNELGQIIDGLLKKACEVIETTPPSTTTSTTTRRPTTTTRTTTTTPKPVTGCDGEMDIVFLVDTSGSIRDRNFRMMREFLAELVNDLAVDSDDIHVGMVTFADDYKLIFDLNEFRNRAEMIDAISAMEYTRGTTNTAAGLQYIREDMFTGRNGDRGNVGNVIVVMTDGNSNDKEKTVIQAMAAKTSGIHIITMALGGWLDEYELRAIASHPWETNLIEVEHYDELGDFVSQLRNLVCNNDDECRPNPCRNGGDCIDAVGGYWCECSNRWGGVNCDYRCREPSDVVFAVDASGSIRKENFEMLVDFTKAVAQYLPIDRDTRVGLETFADDKKIYFNLKDHNSREAIINAMSLPHFSGGTTNTASAIRAMRQIMFTEDNGDRDDPDVAIIVTDGNSNDAEETWAESRDNRAAGIDMVAVGVGNSVNQVELRGMASYPIDRNVFKVDSFFSLNNGIVEEVRDLICNAVDECDSDPCQNGGSCYDMRNGYRCECPRGITGANCERECTGEADIVFILDKSGSIRSQRFEAVKEFFVTVIEEMEIWGDKIRIGLVSFDDDARVEFYMNTYDAKEDIIQAVRLIQYNGGRTNIADALQLARDDVFDDRKGDRETVPNFLITFTDGKANINAEDTIPQAIDTRISGVHIISIGVGNDVDQFELRGIASDPVGSNVFSVDFFNELPELRLPLISAMCDDNNECRNSPCQNGGTCADGLNKYVCLCPSDRTGQTCDRRCNQQYDIAFVLDFSGSVEDVYTRTISFVRRVIYGLEFRFDTVRVGVITFSTDAQVSFALDKYQQKEDVLNALAFSRNGGRTNTAAALQLAREEMFDSGNGDRRQVDNKLVLVTDGGSNVNPQNTVPEAQKLKDDDVEIYVVSIGDKVDMGEISDIASRATEPWVIRIQDDIEVTREADVLLDALCEG